MKRKKRVAIAAVIVTLLAAGGLTRPGRKALSSVAGGLELASSIVIGGAVAQAPPDVEQRARARHNWNNQLIDSVVRGVITYYTDDLVLKQSRITIYYKFPNRVRVEEEYQGLTTAWGFGLQGEWRARSDGLSDQERRDIRGWLRVWPSRLFASRSGGAAYRELGIRPDASRAAVPGRGVRAAGRSRAMHEVEIIDAIEIPVGRGFDERAIRYLIESDSTVSSARWIEPDNPLESVDDPDARTKEIRVDFSGWRRVKGVLLPTEITRLVAGKVDFYIDISEVLINEGLPDEIFQDPGR